MIPREKSPAFQVVFTAGLLSKCPLLLMILGNGMLLCYEEYLGRGCDCDPRGLEREMVVVDVRMSRVKKVWGEGIG